MLPSYGSAILGNPCLRFVILADGIVQVQYAEEFAKAEHSDMVSEVLTLIRKCEPVKV